MSRFLDFKVMILKILPSIVIHSRDAMANPCCYFCGHIQLKYFVAHGPGLP